MNRRTFLATMPIIAGVLAVAPTLALLNVPVLYGDGIHDDTAALQAWINGNRVIRPDGSVVGTDFPVGTFLVRNAITLDRRAVVRCRGKSSSYAGGPTNVRELRYYV